MPALQVTTYEIYIVDSGRWVLHARYRRDEREKALEEARLIERELNTQVKVTREVYDPNTNASEETTIYASEKAGRVGGSGGGGAPRPAFGGAGGRGGGGGFDDFESAGSARGGAARGGAAAARRSPPAVQGTFNALTRLVLILGGSVVGAGLFTMLASNFFQRSLWVQLHVPNLAPVQFMIFIASFLALAVPLATKKVNWAGFEERAPRPKASPKPAKAKQPKVKAAPQPEPDLDETLPVKDPSAEEPTEETPAEEPAAEEAPAEEAEPEAAEGEGAGVEVELQRETMSKFATGLVAEAQKATPKLDTYHQFGVSLMLAGAIDVVGERGNLDTPQRRSLLADTLTSMGTRAESAKTFSAKYEDYMVEKRYLGMIQAGRVAAEQYLENPDAPLPPMKSLFDAWGKPQEQQAAPRIVAVMFTDMVGSTDMTQAKGDQAAQVIVRRHNSIVRAALNEYGGKQVKHTGDGIMASFPSPSAGVQAAVAIQRAVAANNARFPDQELHLRIGINAGEPIVEEEDLFGATVQLAARVCAAAGTDQIVCTNVVRELSGGNKNIGFASRGPQSLKGFSEKISLFEVSWNG